ncbi:MAG: dihydroxy-acid dehydratase [Sphingobium sp.]|nr:dihydroxy-acid dehydratase [Sphingobium sp.]
MTKPLRSAAADSLHRRAHWYQLGLTEEDMAKPKIAVVNSSSELAVCFAHLDGVAKVVKDAIRQAGGIPFEVRTTAPSDFITGAGKSGSYILAGRDLVTHDIEVQVEAAMLDGMVCLTSCDKTPPGHMMAAGRLNIPTILVIGGYQASGMIDGDHVDLEDLWSGGVGTRFGKPLPHDKDEMVRQAIRGPGVCAGMATANTMHCVVEAIGMSLPGSGPVRANSRKMFDAARESGRRIVEMVLEDLTPRQIMTPGAFRNAVATVLAVSGSINAIKHLQAIAVECGMDLDIFKLWDEVGRQVPVLSAVRPNGEVRIEEFEDAGGARGILKQLEPLLDLDAVTCSGKRMGEILGDYKVPDAEIIRPLADPISEGPSIVILKGSLAPESAVVKLGIRDGSRPEFFEGTARCFENNASCLAAIERGDVKSGDVVILRGQGLKGGPAMGGGASVVLFALDAAGIAKETAFVTDCQLSGLCLKGLTVAEVAPESADGGPLGLVEDGDRIRIDVANRALDLLVDPAVLAQRTPKVAKKADGYLGIYQRDVQPMSTGAVLVD